MKYLFVLIIVITGLQLNAQSNSVSYDTCHYMSQFAGEWLYTNGNDTIKVYLRFSRDSSANFKFVRDRLFGWHEYKHGNTIIESNYQHRFMSLPYDADSGTTHIRSILLSLKECSDFNNILIGSITDYKEAEELHTVTVMLDATKTQMTWKQMHSEGYGFGTGATGMTLPKEFLLIKQ